MKPITHTQTVMLRLLTMCIPFRNLRKKGRAFLRDFLSDYDRNARRSMRAWRRHAVAGRTILILEPNYCHATEKSSPVFAVICLTWDAALMS